MRNQCFAFFVSKDDASDMEDRQEVREVNIRLSWQYGYGTQDNQV